MPGPGATVGLAMAVARPRPHMGLAFIKKPKRRKKLLPRRRDARRKREPRPKPIAGRNQLVGEAPNVPLL